jgi:hypothetical protein
MFLNMKIINKDILTVEKGIICQQVNAMGVMGSGLAKQIKEKWPEVIEPYQKFCKKYDYWRMDLLGKSLQIPINEKLVIANIFGQFNYGYDKRRYTDYCALNQGFFNLRSWNGIARLDIYFPHNFGCDRGGGDWKIVEKMIDYYFSNAIVCKL